MLSLGSEVSFPPLKAFNIDYNKVWKLSGIVRYIDTVE